MAIHRASDPRLPDEEIQRVLDQAWHEPAPRDAVDRAVPAICALIADGRIDEAHRAGTLLLEVLQGELRLPSRAVGLMDVVSALWGPDELASLRASVWAEAMQLILEHGYGWKRDAWLASWVVEIAKTDCARALALAQEIHRPRYRRHVLRAIGEWVPNTALGAPPGSMLPPRHFGYAPGSRFIP